MQATFKDLIYAAHNLIKSEIDELAWFQLAEEAGYDPEMLWQEIQDGLWPY